MLHIACLRWEPRRLPVGLGFPVSLQTTRLDCRAVSAGYAWHHPLPSWPPLLAQYFSAGCDVYIDVSKCISLCATSCAHGWHQGSGRIVTHHVLAGACAFAACALSSCGHTVRYFVLLPNAICCGCSVPHACVHVCTLARSVDVTTCEPIR